MCDKLRDPLRKYLGTRRGRHLIQHSAAESELPTQAEDGTPGRKPTPVLCEILELERQGIDVRIVSLKLPNDGRFHADVERVTAPVPYVPTVERANTRVYLGQHWRVFNCHAPLAASTGRDNRCSIPCMSGVT